MMASGDDMIFHGGGPYHLPPFSGFVYVQNCLRFKKTKIDLHKDC